MESWADQSERTKIGFDPSKEHDRSIGARAYIGSKTKKMQSRVKQMEKRIALAGKNGCGKSTLIRQILQKCGLPQKNFSVFEKGVCEVAAGLVISYVGQDTSGLKGDMESFCREHMIFVEHDVRFREKIATGIVEL